MKKNYGKIFEEKFKTQWKRDFPNEFLLRLRDSTSGFRGASQNPCDFIAHINNTLLMLEIKSHYGNTFPWSAFSQYDELLKYNHLKNVKIFLIVWFIDHDTVAMVSLNTCKKMKEEGLKSINIKDLSKYNILCVPSKKKRVFLDSDYTVVRGLINESKD